MNHRAIFCIRHLFSRMKTNFIYALLGVIYPAKIQRGDKVICHGIGYPHWKGYEFECTLNFKDGTIGIKNEIRVSKKDFRKA